MQEKITFDRLVRWMGIALVIGIVIFAVDYLSSVLLPFFVAWFLAYLTYPLVKFIQYRLHVKVRTIAIIITMLLLLCFVGLIVYLIIPPMIEQIQKVGDIISHWVQHKSNSNEIVVRVQDWVAANREQIEAFFRSSDFSNTVKAAMPKLFSLLGQTATVIISIIASMITLLYMFFILLDYEYLTNSVVKIFPKKSRPFWNALIHDVERALNNYIRGQGLVALCMGIMFCIGFSLMDFPMAIGLGILIGILDLVPYLHTFALIPTAFLAMLKASDTGQSFWLIFGMAVGLFIVVQIITDMIVTPKIMGKAMGLNPAVLLLSLSVWGALLGFIGLIIALPATTLIIAYWQRYVTHETDEKHPPVKPTPPESKTKTEK